MRNLFIVLALISILVLAGCPKQNTPPPTGGDTGTPTEPSGGEDTGGEYAVTATSAPAAPASAASSANVIV